MFVKALTAATAGSTAVPTLATDGRALRVGGANHVPREGFSDDVDECEVLVYGTSDGGAAVSVAYVRIWLGMPSPVDSSVFLWFPAGTGVTDDKGKLNADHTTPFLIDETSSDTVRHAERLRGFREFTRVYIQLGAFTNNFNASGLNVLLVTRG